MEHARKDNISEALTLLEEAARQKKDELKSVISDKYLHLKRVMVEAEQRLAHSLSDTGKHAFNAAVHAKDVSVDKAREVARDVDKSVHQNPWVYLAGTAGIGLLLGYVLGRNRK